MKQLIDIIEALKINSKSKVGKYDPDRLNNEEFVLYDDTAYDGEDEDDKDIDWEDCEKELETIQREYDYFFVTKFEPISKIKDFEKSIYHIDESLDDIKDKIITGKDYGYAIRVSYGHMEIDCINSGSRATYYIYALTHEAYDKMICWWESPDELEGKNDEEKLSFLFEEGNIVEINLK